MKKVFRQHRRSTLTGFSSVMLQFESRMLNKFILSLIVFMMFGLVTNAQKAFEGKISYNIQVIGIDADRTADQIPQFLEYLIADDHIRMNVTGREEGTDYSFILEQDFIIEPDFLAGLEQDYLTFYSATPKFLIKHAESTVFEIPIQANDKAESAKLNQLEKVDKPVAIQGYICQKYKIINANPMDRDIVQYVWLTDELVMPNSKATIQIEGNGFIDGRLGIPLKIKSEEYGRTIIMTAYWVDESKVNKSEFEIPEDYELKDFRVLQM